MKNKKGFILLMLLLTFALATTSAYAGETDDTSNRGPMSLELFESKIDERIESYTERAEEFLIERTSNFQERSSKANDSYEFRLNVVTDYAPDLIEAFDQAFNGHLEVHQLLFETSYSLHEDYHGETLAGMGSLKVEVLTAIEEGSMTYREASDVLKEYLQGRREEYIELRSQYQDEITYLNEENDETKEIVAQLKAELRTAVQEEDYDTCETIIAELIEYANIHTEYDYAKLDILLTY